jgi:branched-chain amino acid transport system substrate-binding protein
MEVVMKKLAVICIGVSFFLMLVSCGNTRETAGRELYIPILADAAWLTSDGSFINGVRLAQEELNGEIASKGYHIKTEVVDDKAQYETGVEMAARVAADPAVTAVFNLQNFDVSKTTAGILADQGKLTLFPYGAYDSLFTQGNPYLLCGVPAFSDLGRAMAYYAVKQGYRRIAVYHNGIQSQEELVKAFELALSGTDSKVVDYVPSIASESEFDGIYSRWQALGADCVVISQYGLERSFEVLKMLRSRDKAIAVMGEPIFNRANALAENKSIAEGMTVPSTLVIEDGEKRKAFQERYKAKYGAEADIWAVQGYDLLRMVADTAVRIGTNDPSAIAKALHGEEGYAGVGRHIAFTEGGALVTDGTKLPILKCRDGKFE